MRIQRTLHARRDDGVALPMVLILGIVMMTLVSTALLVVVSGLKQASTDQDYSAAIDAAYAGVGDYMARLTANPLYVQDGNPSDAKFGASGTRTMDSTNKAFGLGTSGSWATVPGSDSAHPAKYRYEVDNSAYQATGTVRLRATGLVGTTVRTVVANIRVRGFFDYVYFTDKETQDPALTGKTGCDVYAWGGRSSSCPTVQFGSHDTIEGPLHSNDTIVSCNATFDGAVTSASTTTPIVQVATGCASSGTFNAGPPTRAAVISLPDSNSSMATVAATSGCLYTGPTTVTYNANGTMTVVSPWTKQTRPDAANPTPAECGSVTDLQSTGATVSQLDQNLLFVQAVPSTTSDPNYWGAGTRPTGFTCLGADGDTSISGTTGSAGWKFVSGSSVLRHPLDGEAPATGWTNTTNGTLWSTTAPAYGCTNGDLYVKGVDTTQTTAASANYVYVTGDLTMKDKAKDILGVIGDKGVLVYNPMKDSGTVDQYGDEVYQSMLGDSGREIDAAVMSVADTFQVQNYDKGDPRGTLIVYGSIAQKFRGPVGTGNATAIVTGYAKSYAYDPLLKTSGPPDFLEPSSTTFAISQYASVPAAFTATGSAAS